MKFSEIDQERWGELREFLDTALLPVSGLIGEEEPWNASNILEKLRDALDPLEQPFKGRVVTYPAVHYAASEVELAELVNRLCLKLKSAGFRFVIVVSGKECIAGLQLSEASLVLAPREGDAPESAADYKARVRKAVEMLWYGGAGK